MDPKLYLKVGDGEEVDVSEVVNGLKFLGDDEAPVMLQTYQSSVGLDGQLAQEINYDKSIVTAKFWLHFTDWYDYKLAKHEIYKLFNQRKQMRIRTDAEPAIVKYVLPTSFSISPTEDYSHDALFEIPFENPSGYKYSLFRSDTPYTFEQNGWQVGMNLPADRIPTYHFTSSKFTVYNASDIAVDPYYQKHDLKIISKFKGDSLKITNKTNGTEWAYKKKSDGTETIILDGVNSFRDGKSCGSDTDWGNLSLERGDNQIEVTGATSTDITFSFPFLYLA
ncbi:phage tail family protein [Pediococcus stilesii]|uniref:Phage tail family protein n=2 Tax=Pediococcus stilesii TaxID=331679 RepID=A0A5R9BSU6_9LACO|nr:phage tail family protein [Pediococcus stilesii]